MPILFFALFIVGLTYAAYSDWTRRRVSNGFLIGALACGTFMVVSGVGKTVPGFAADPLIGSLGMLLGLLVLLPAFALRAVGAGDVKFLAILGLWTGVQSLLWTWVVASLLAMVHAFTCTLIARRNAATEHRGSSQARRTGLRGIPYVSYLALGAMFEMGQACLSQLDPVAAAL